MSVLCVWLYLVGVMLCDVLVSMICERRAAVLGVWKEAVMVHAKHRITGDIVRVEGVGEGGALSG